MKVDINKDYRRWQKKRSTARRLKKGGKTGKNQTRQ